MISLKKLAAQKGISTVFVPIEKLNKLGQGNHQGAIATVAPIGFVSMEALVDGVCAAKESPLFLVLDQVSDVRNFGAMIRTASCTGVDGIIIQSKGAAPVNADTVKTSAGAVYTVPIAKVDHIKDAVYYLQSSGIQVVSATEKATKTIYETDLTPGIALVMGAEDTGISPTILKITDHQASLPILGEIASLNVSVACGVILYEVVRQRTPKG